MIKVGVVWYPSIFVCGRLLDYSTSCVDGLVKNLAAVSSAHFRRCSSLKAPTVESLSWPRRARSASMAAPSHARPIQSINSIIFYLVSLNHLHLSAERLVR